MVTLILLALLLLSAALGDIRTQRIPNRLTVTGLILGLAWNGWQAGGEGLLRSLVGVGAAGLALLPYALRGLGAGDVKLLAVVGAWMGPLFLLWTLLGTILAGGLLALIWALAAASLGRRMPLAPAIALGAAFAAFQAHPRLLP